MEATLESIDMSGAVSLLHKLFEQAQSDLKQLSRRLEQQFVDDFQHIGNGKVNPRRILRRLEELSARVNTACARSEKITAKKEALAKDCFSLAVKTQTGLQRLSQLTRADKEDEIEGEYEADFEQLEAFTSSTSTQADDATDDTDVDATSENAENEDLTPEQHPENRAKLSTRGRHENVEAAASVAMNEYTPVSEKEFEHLSSLVKGRAKLKEVNKVYKVLFEHFQQANKAKHNKYQKIPALSTKEMANMGLKITGHTGEARLKVLRATGRLLLSKKGVLIDFEE